MFSLYCRTTNGELPRINFPSAYMLLQIQATASLYQGKYEVAVNSAGKYLKIKSDDLHMLWVRGVSYYKMGDVETAKAHYQVLESVDSFLFQLPFLSLSLSLFLSRPFFYAGVLTRFKP